MRRITIILISIAVMAFVSACNMNLTVEGPGKGFVRKTIHLSASEIITSKAIFGEKEDTAYPMLWQEGDVVYVSVNGAAACSKELAADDIKAGGRAADFGLLELDLPKEGAITIKVTTNTNDAGTSATIKYSPSAGRYQEPQETSCDPSCVVLFATASYDSAGSVPETLDLRFSHTTAYGLMSISGITLGGGETIKFVELQSMSTAVKIAGDVTLDDKGSLSGAGYTSMTLKGIEDLGKPIWFAIAPAVFESANALAIHVVTTADNHYEKILDCSTNNLEFQAGHVSKFGVDFSGISSAPRQVKTARDLVLLKNALNNSDYGYWVNSDDEIMLANDIDYNNDAVSGNKTTLPAGVTFNGQNHAIQNATISATIFKTVAGTVKNLSIEGGTGSTNLFETVSGELDHITISDLSTTKPLINSVSGIVDHLTISEFSPTASLIASVESGGEVDNLSLEGGEGSSILFTTVSGKLDYITISDFTTTAPLINTVESTGIVDHLTVDDESSYNCSWNSKNMALVTFYNHGIIQNSEVSASITLADPNTTSFFFGVFCPHCTDGQFIKCINKSNISCSNSHYTRNSGIGGIVGLINSSQNNSVKILKECRNEGNISLTIGAGTGYSRVCCVGGIAGGNYKGQYEALPWKDASMPSNGVIYKCQNSGIVTLTWNGSYSNATDDDKGSQGASAGGIVGATVNDVVECTNIGSVVVNCNVGGAETTAAPKIGGIVGCAHNRVVDCINGDSTNSSKGSIEVNGRVRNISSKLYNGTGPIQYPCIGGVAGAVGCNDAANSIAAGSEISGCTNYAASITDNSSVTAGGTKYVGSVCGWTVASNSNNTDEGNTELPILNPQ